MMKSISETKFDKVIKEGFYSTLKPLGFKKKGNNFYSQKVGIGHIVNLQKSTQYSKNHIHFTINTAVFLPEFWSDYNYFNKPVPDYPTELECILRQRIGDLRNENDKWYDITSDTIEEEMIKEMKTNLNQYILPHFSRILSKNMLIDFLDSQTTRLVPLEKLIVFGELGYKEKAIMEFQNIIANTTRNPDFLATIKEYGKKYGLI